MISQNDIAYSPHGYTPSTYERKTIRLLRTWGMTQGYVWKITKTRVIR